VKKKRIGNMSAKSDLEEATPKKEYALSTADEKHIDNALIGACNSFVYFLQDEAGKLTSLGAAAAMGQSTLFNISTLDSMRESLEITFIQSIRAASEVGDFILLPKIVYAAVDYASAFRRYASLYYADDLMPKSHHLSLALLQPRLFGEAISSLSKTKASASKIKAMWNYFVHDVANGEKQSVHGEIPSLSSVLVSPPSTYELNAMISALASRGKIRAAIKLYRQFAVEEREDGCTIEADAYTASALFGMLADSITADAGGVSSSLMPQDGKSERSKKSNSPCWQWNEALELLDTLSPHQLNNVAYASLLKLNDRATELYLDESVKHSGVPAAMTVLDRMKRDEFSPDVVTCSIIMSTFDKGRHWKAALSLLNAMRASSGLPEIENSTMSAGLANSTQWTLPPPNMITYALAISACARCDKRKVVLSLFDQMSKAQEQDSDTPIEPNTWVYNAALSACVESCRAAASKSKQGIHLATALDILEKMETNGNEDVNTAPDVDSYNLVLSILGQRILTEAKEKKKGARDETKRIMRYEHNSDMVYDIIDSMERQGVKRNAETYSNAILACFSRPFDVITLFRRSLVDLNAGENGKMNGRSKAKIVAVANAALTSAASLGDMAVVSEVLSLLSEADIKINVESISLIIQTLGKSGDCEAILVLLASLREEDFVNDVLNDRHSIDILGNLPTKLIPVLDEKVYSVAVTSCLKHNELSMADQIMHLMKSKGLSLTQRSLNDIIDEYCRMAMEASREEYKAAKLAKEYGLASSKFQILEPVYITSSVRSKSALAMLRDVDKPSRILLSTVTKACAASGLWQEARSILRRMHRAAIREIKERKSLGELPRLHRYLFKLCAKGGHITHALNFADDIQYLEQRVHIQRRSLLENDYMDESYTALGSLSSLLLSDNSGAEELAQKSLKKRTGVKVLGRSIGLTGQDWKLLLMAAWRGGHWKVCVGTLPFIRPYVEDTNPKLSREMSEDEELDRRKPSLESLESNYHRLESAITAAVLCFETRGQYAWAIRSLEDWIEWSGRRPPKGAVTAACRVLAKRFRGAEVLNLVNRVINNNDMHNTMTLTEPSEYSYEKAIFAESINALHLSGLYEEADYLYEEGARLGYLSWAVVEEDASTTDMKLDLHGMSAAIAHSAIRVSLQQEIMKSHLLSRPGAVNWTKDIIIITGKGRRSGQKFRPVLRPECQRMLTEEFFPPMSSSTIPGNLGALVVRSEEIANWLDHQSQQKGDRLLAVADVIRGLSSGSRLERAILSSGNRLEQALKRNIKNQSQRDETN
jgi:pentatricopeptide repeat protein